MCVWGGDKGEGAAACACVSEVFERRTVYVLGVRVSIRGMQKEVRLKWNEGKRRVPRREKRGIACQSV